MCVRACSTSEKEDQSQPSPNRTDLAKMEEDKKKKTKKTAKSAGKIIQISVKTRGAPTTWRRLGQLRPRKLVTSGRVKTGRRVYVAFLERDAD